MKYLILALSALSLSGQVNQAHTLQEAIRLEISTIIYKLLIGLVLTAIIIFSLFQFGENFKNLLDTFENGLGLKMLSFGSISLLGIYLLYFLFKRNPASTSTNKDSNINGIDFQTIGIQFIEGMIEGYNSHEQNKQANSNNDNQK